MEDLLYQRPCQWEYKMKFDFKRIAICVLGAIIIVFALYQIFKGSYHDAAKFEVVLSESLEPVMYYEGDRNYYLYGLERVTVTYMDDTKELKEFLKDGVAIEDLVFHMESNASYDGGSVLYHDENIAVLVCHRSIPSDGYNEDVYIGNSNMGYEEGFCEGE